MAACVVWAIYSQMLFHEILDSENCNCDSLSKANLFYTSKYFKNVQVPI